MDLAQLLDDLRQAEGDADPRLIVGLSTNDDAGVFALTDEIALVHTADVIAPLSDDPYRFGQIAAANSLSDVYAMGAEPLTALNLAFFPSPSAGVPPEALGEILRGASDTVRAAGAFLGGGHTVRDDDIKFGLSVTGTCHPDRVLTNAGARPGERLVLTKPLGTGLLVDALRRGWVTEADLAEALDWMAALNDISGRAAVAHGASAATDVTGFALAGHAGEMARGSGVGLRLEYDRLPRYSQALELIERGGKTGLTGANRESVADLLRIDSAGSVSDTEQALLFDPQTSGGLLVSLPPEAAEAYVLELREAGNTAAAVVGEVLDTDSDGHAFLEVVRGG